MPIQQMLLGAGSLFEADPGQFLLTSNQTSGYSWTVPDGVRSISVVCIGGGGTPSAGSSGYSSGGGGLAYANNITVTPGATLTLTNYTAPSNSSDDTVISGPASGSQAAWSLTAGCGYQNTGGDRSATGNPGSVSSSTPPGGNGGSGYDSPVHTFGSYIWSGGGGAAGYGGNGGNGGYADGCSGWGCDPGYNNAQNGSNGGGGGGGNGLGVSNSDGSSQTSGIGGGGGGTAPYGQGSSGSGGTSNQSSTYANGSAGQGGSYVSGLSGGTPTDNTDDDGDCWDGGSYGGGCGAGGTWSSSGTMPNQGGGCIRIIWPGTDRQFPSTRTANE